VPEPVPAQNTAPAAASSHSTSLSAEDLYAAASRSIVVIGVVGTRDADEAFFGQGSGVVVKPGRVVTNCHVVESAQAAGVFYQGEYFGSVSIVDAHPARDLCLLDAGSLPAPPIRLGTVSSLRIGQQVFAIGAPQGLDIGLDLTLSEGLVSALRRKEGETLPLIQTSAPISQGSSGGALLASDGSLVGITTMVHKTGQNLNFAVPVDWIRDFPDAR
jgi:S1-C subfamily serine protease